MCIRDRALLISSNLGLVRSVIGKFSNIGYERDDLFQLGSIGLIKAIYKFDPSYNVKFSTYAVPMILGEIKRYLRDDGMVKVSRSLKQLAIKVKMLSLIHILRISISFIFSYFVHHRLN